MKKIITLLFIAALALLLIACGGNQEPNIVISKLLTATDDLGQSPHTANNVIELYNNSDDAVTLTGNLVVRIYREGNPNITNEFPIQGVILPNSFFVIASVNHANPDILARADFLTATNMAFNGDDPVALIWRGELLDIIGNPNGAGTVFSRHQTMIRMGEVADFAPSTTYDFLAPHFIGYAPNLWNYIGVWEHGIRTEAQMLAGPRLEDRFLEMDFAQIIMGNLVGGGGAIPVRLDSIADGDTASFSSPVITQFGLNNSVRYHFINTPEVPGSAFVTPEPWGLVASYFNRQFIHLGNINLANQQQTIHLQSLPGGTLQDTTSSRRTMALVWVNGYLQQFFVVREGLSEVGVTVSTDEIALTYQNVLIRTFLLFAQKYARNNNIGMWSGPAMAPDWDVATNSPITIGWQAEWFPHQPLPWSS